MTANLVLKLLHIVLKLRNNVLLLKNFQMLFTLVQFYQVLDPLIDAILESL